MTPPEDENAPAAPDCQHQREPAAAPTSAGPSDDGPSTSGSGPSAATSADALDMRSLVTITLNTSPVPCHPSTRLVEEIVASIFAHSPEVAGCRIVIIADGYKVRLVVWISLPVRGGGGIFDEI